MNQILEQATSSVHRSVTSFCKFISANDAGKTGAHQEGFYMPKNSIPLMFSVPGLKGENKDRIIKIKWQNSFETESRFIYYGKGTRNEYRLTRFGKGFPFLSEENVGNLLILSHIADDYYEGFVLDTEDEIESFLSEFNLSPLETNGLINKDNLMSSESQMIHCFNSFIDQLEVNFPGSFEISQQARLCYNKSYGITIERIVNHPDESILSWLNTEYELFKAIENVRYKTILNRNFQSVSEFIELANSILNRRKSRAGKSLENHLSEMFKLSNLKFESQASIEGNKKPDFLFPNSFSYNDSSFNQQNLVFLASKTTCKDRWRQILNEADKIETKHLFTLQQGISTNQLKEMYEYKVKLVVPRQFISTFPIPFQSKILSLSDFIGYVQSKQI
jgi:type II restriction enzyme